MADVTKVKASDGTIYDINDVNDYTKDETDALLADKANSADVYDKTQVDNLLAGKPDAAVVEGELALKANVVDVYSKTEADNLLAGKADTGVSYSKAEDDALLADKANSADVYTITQTDGLLADKAGIDDSSTTATTATWSADKLNVEFQGKADTSDVYTKAEVDTLIGGVKMKSYYTKVDMDNTKAVTVDISSLNLSSADDYFVIINGGDCADYSGSTYNAGSNWSLYIDAKTSTSFTIKAQGSGLINWRADIHISCQVVYS